MCLSTPVEVTKVEKGNVFVGKGNSTRQINTSLLDDIKLGDYLLVTGGLAINKVSRQDAKKVLKLVKDWQEV